MKVFGRAFGFVRRHKLAAAICLCVVALVSISAIRRGRTRVAPKVQGETAVVTRGPLDITVEAKGTLVAAETIKISAEISNWARISWVIDDGAEVKKGDVLAKLDGGDLDERIRQSTMDVDRCANQVLMTEEQLKLALTSAETNVASAKLRFEIAKMASAQYGMVALGPDGLIDEAAYEAPSAPAKGDAYDRFRNAALEIERAKTALVRARTDYMGMDEMLAKGYITKNEYVASELAVLEAERRLESANLSYEILKTYTYPQELARVRQNLFDGQNGLQAAELQASVNVSTARKSAWSAKFEYDRRKKDLDENKAELDRMQVKSPADGQILYGDGQPWSKYEVSVGRHVWRGSRLFSIPNMASIIARVRVLEMDVNQVKVGQDVRLTLDSLPGVTLAGKISKVAEYGSSGGRWGSTQDIRMFEVEIKFDNADSKGKSGATCTGEVLLESIPETTYVPVLAVFNRGDKRVCQVVSGGATSEVEVTTGRASEKFVEILSGLEPGQKVLLAETKSPQKSAAEKGGG